MKKLTLDRLMNRLSLLLLLGTAAFLAVYWRHIPEEVPMHFNAAGEIDRWGRRADLLPLPLLSWLMYGLVTAMELILGALGSGTWTEEGRRERALALLRHMASTMKLLLTVVFSWITLCCALARALPTWFLPAMLAAVFGNLLFWVLRLLLPGRPRGA